MARVNFEEVKAASLANALDLLFRWYPLGRVNGHEFEIGSLQGEAGHSLSVNVNTGRWCDFAAGPRGGDLIDLYCQKTGMEVVDACRDIMQQLSMAPVERPANAAAAPRARKANPRVQEWRHQMPPPADKPVPVSHFKYGKPDHVAIVRNQDGEMLHVIHRFEASERTGGKKQIIPWTYGYVKYEDGTEATKWHAMAPNAPRPLYGLPLRPGYSRLIVEGEKKRDAAARLLEGTRWDVVSWPNGFQGLGHADWEALRGDVVAVWPDNDEPGERAAHALANALRGVAEDFRIVDLPADLPPKWDLADAEEAGWTTRQVLEILDPAAAREMDAAEHAAQEDAQDHDREEDEEPPHGGPPAEERGWPFRCLGHDLGRYFFLPEGTGQVVSLSAKDLHSSAALAALGRLSWWEGAFPFQKKAGIDVAAAGDALLRACERVGVYDDDRIRGRGVWIDRGRTVLHLGNRLICGNREVRPAQFDSDLIYQSARPLPIPLEEGASNKEAAELIALCSAVSWEDPKRDGRILAGWLVVAMVCGAMPWRPHVWITSEAGGGKSWVVANIIQPVLGALALRVQGNTSEAGIRGDLRSDARPVVFDEAESQDEESRKRIQGVLNLARQASSEDGAKVLKGTREGGSQGFVIRSCFAFASVNLGLTQAADESRTMPLNIAPNNDPVAGDAAFVKLKALQRAVIVPGFSARLLARTLALVPVIRANAETLAAAIARGGVTRRTGDTMGVILAGAYSLTSTKQMTDEEAERFLAERQWVGSTARDAEARPEWQRAIMRLMQWDIRFQGHNEHTAVVKVGDLIAACSPGPSEERRAPPAEADRVLRAAGIRVMDETPMMIRIANGSEVAAAAFAGTPWAAAWRATLERAPGGKRNVPTRFNRYLQDKAVVFPLKHALPDTPDTAL